MARKRTPSTNSASFWDELVLPMPRRAVNAAIAAAHNYDIEATEYCRRAILLRLAADGMNLRDFGEAA